MLRHDFENQIINKKQEELTKERRAKRNASKGLLKLARDPKRFFKDVVGEKKSIFARNLKSVKKFLKKEIKRETLFLKKITVSILIYTTKFTLYLHSLSNFFKSSMFSF